MQVSRVARLHLSIYQCACCDPVDVYIDIYIDIYEQHTCSRFRQLEAQEQAFRTRQITARGTQHSRVHPGPNLRHASNHPWQEQMFTTAHFAGAAICARSPMHPVAAASSGLQHQSTLGGSPVHAAERTQHAPLQGLPHTQQNQHPTQEQAVVRCGSTFYSSSPPWVTWVLDFSAVQVDACNDPKGDGSGSNSPVRDKVAAQDAGQVVV